jgi:2-isopropylmalate synthase
MENKLRMSPETGFRIEQFMAVKWALDYTDDVEFSAEDAVRSDINFLIEIFDAVIKAGAKTINVPDTVGYSIPNSWGERIW